MSVTRCHAKIIRNFVVRDSRSDVTASQKQTYALLQTTSAMFGDVKTEVVLAV